MAHERVHRVQDPVHGLIEFSHPYDVVMDLLQCEELQRLRRIRQLGLANLVFPGAEHSRLTHALGTAHLGIRFGSRLMTAEAAYDLEWAMCKEDVRDLVVAGLCHDIGHGPLSHVFETAMIGDFDRDAWHRALGLQPSAATEVSSWHELVGQGLLAWPEGDLHRRLERVEPGLPDRISRLLKGTHRLPYLPGMLRGDIDIDRCDFLLRDAFQTGVPYGRFDLDWLISTLHLARSGDQIVAGYQAGKARLAIGQMLAARRAMYQAVYHHRSTRAAEALLGLLFSRLRAVTARGDWPLPDAAFRSWRRVAEQQPLEPQEILMLDDHGLWTLIAALAHGPHVDRTLRDLASRLRRRDILRAIPLDPDQAARWSGRLDDLAATCAHALPSEASFYLWMDSPESAHPRSEPTFLLKASRGGMAEVIPLRDDLELGHLLQIAPQPVTIYAPREAIPTVELAVRL